MAVWLFARGRPFCVVLSHESPAISYFSRGMCRPRNRSRSNREASSASTHLDGPQMTSHRRFPVTGNARSVCPCTLQHLRWLLLARIVGWVDVVDPSRPGELHLDDRLLVACPHIMRLLCRLRVESPRLAQLAFLFECFAHTEADAPADHGDGFGIRMGVRRYVVVGRELDALHDYLARLRRVAEQNGDLGTLRNIRIVLPGQRIGRDHGDLHGIL